MLGYADESGEPGIMKNEHDYFVFCIVLLKNHEQALKISDTIIRFRNKNGLPSNHEFHYSTDSKKTREKFMKLIGRLDFQFISIAIRKNKYLKTASFAKMAELILQSLKRHNLNARIVMDTNPRLCKELKNRKKQYCICVSFLEKKSRGNDLIQLADYVTALKTRHIKYPHKKIITSQYGFIANKCLDEKVV